jgi:general secretion pathway protein G
MLAKQRKAAGFTLIELLIVMAILGMLATLVGPTIWGHFKKSQITIARQQISSYSQALDAYRLDLGKYPKSLDSLLKNDSNNNAWNGPYIKELPKDPWGNVYQYQAPGKHNKDYDLYSFGGDGREGGDGENADVGNWKS